MDPNNKTTTTPESTIQQSTIPNKWMTKTRVNSQTSSPTKSEKEKVEKAERGKTVKIEDKYYCIFPGNGFNVLNWALQKKRGWKQLNNNLAFNGKCNFIWKPCNFDYMQYCQIDRLMHNGFLAQEKKNHYLVQENINPIEAQVNEFITQKNKVLAVNHLENNREITTKTGLIRSLKQYYKNHIPAIQNGYGLYDTTPTTFIVSSNLDTYEYFQFVKRFQDLKKNYNEVQQEKVPPKHCKENMWIVKPANDNQGNGIKIFNNLYKITRFLESSESYTYWVVQKYLERPLLYKKRKFDIRVWGIANSHEELFFCKLGYIRTSSSEYETDKADEYVHLTNNCLQMRDQKNYGKHEQGNVVSFQDFQQYLNDEYGEYKLNFDQDFLTRMKDLAIDCHLSAKTTMNPSKRRNCFELLGYDFMIDEDFRIWLIEVNTNPYIGIYNDKMQDLLPQMLNGFYKIVLDPIFEKLTPKQEANICSGTCWELLYSDHQGVNMRREILTGLYPVKKLSQRQELTKQIKKQLMKLAKKRQDQLEKVGMQAKIIKSIPSKKELYESFHQPSIQRAKSIALVDNLNKQVSQNTLKEQISSIKRSNSITISKGYNTIMKPTQQLSEYSDEEDNDSDNNSIAEIGFPTITQEDDPETVRKLKMNLKPEKTIIAQVKTLDIRSKYYKDQIFQIMQRIISTCQSWELFSDNQIEDSIKALKMMQRNFIFYNPQEQKPIVRALIQLIGLTEVPLHIRFEIAVNVFIMMRNKIFCTIFLLDPIEAHTSLQPLYRTLQSSCINDDGYTNNKKMRELFLMCVNILILIYNRDKEPGEAKETMERIKLRQSAIDAGVLVIAAFIQCETKNKALKQYIHEQLLEKIEEPDFEYHFKKNLTHYTLVSDIITELEQRERIDQLLCQYWKMVRIGKQKENQLQLQKIQEQELKQLKMLRLREEAKEEKRRQIQSTRDRRIRDVQKQQTERMKKQNKQEEERTRLNEEMRKRKENALLLKKAERTQREYQQMQEKYRREKQMIEDVQKQNRNREFAKHLALEKWHRDKKEEDQRRKLRVTSNVKKQIDFLKEKYKQYDPKAAMHMMNKLKAENEQQQAIQQQQLNKFNKTGSKPFLMNDFILSSDELSTKDIHDRHQSKVIASSPVVPKKTYLSDFQKAFSASKKSDYRYEQFDKQVGRNDDQVSQFQKPYLYYDIQSQVMMNSQMTASLESNTHQYLQQYYSQEGEINSKYRGVPFREGTPSVSKGLVSEPQLQTCQPNGGKTDMMQSLINQWAENQLLIKEQEQKMHKKSESNTNTISQRKKKEFQFYEQSNSQEKSLPEIKKDGESDLVILKTSESRNRVNQASQPNSEQRMQKGNVNIVDDEDTDTQGRSFNPNKYYLTKPKTTLRKSPFNENMNKTQTSFVNRGVSTQRQSNYSDIKQMWQVTKQRKSIEDHQLKSGAFSNVVSPHQNNRVKSNGTLALLNYCSQQEPAENKYVSKHYLTQNLTGTVENKYATQNRKLQNLFHNKREYNNDMGEQHVQSGTNSVVVNHNYNQDSKTPIYDVSRNDIKAMNQGHFSVVINQQKSLQSATNQSGGNKLRKLKQMPQQPNNQQQALSTNRSSTKKNHHNYMLLDTSTVQSPQVNQDGQVSNLSSTIELNNIQNGEIHVNQQMYKQPKTTKNLRLSNTQICINSINNEIMNIKRPRIKVNEQIASGEFQPIKNVNVTTVSKNTPANGPKVYKPTPRQDQYDAVMYLEQHLRSQFVSNKNQKAGRQQKKPILQTQPQRQQRGKVVLADQPPQEKFMSVYNNPYLKYMKDGRRITADFMTSPPQSAVNRS